MSLNKQLILTLKIRIMAFCGKCGTQLSDGAKFCPKCGQPIDSDETNIVQNPITSNSYDDEPEEEQIKTWQKVVSVLFWPAGAILIIAALIKKQSELAKSALIYTAIGIGLAIALNIALGGCSNNYSNDVESVSSYSDDDSSYDLDNVAKVGYENGYEMGFNCADIDIEPDAKPSFSANYGAPQTAEEKKVYDVYKQNYDRGYREGVRAGRQ